MEDNLLLSSLEKNSKECVVENRRKGPDFLLVLINAFCYLVWAFLLIVMSLCDGAGIAFHKINLIKLEDINISFVNIAINFSAIIFLVSWILLMLSFRRCRRRTDKIKISIFIGEIVSFMIWILLVNKVYF